MHWLRMGLGRLIIVLQEKYWRQIGCLEEKFVILKYAFACLVANKMSEIGEEY